jgi:hypothetical protein
MAGAGPVTPEVLADRTGITPRYVREWLSNQAAGGYVTYRPQDGTFELPAEHAAVLADENSPVFLGGAYEGIASCYSDYPWFIDAFRTGTGVGWEQHDGRLFSGVRRLFRPSYAAYLTTAWIPALDGVEAKLRAGASVADVGCGLGASTIIMAEAYPHSTFAGYDYHEPSIEAARKSAADAAVNHRVRFETAAAGTFPGTGLPAAHHCARPTRPTAAGSPASTAASAHSAAYQGRQSPLCQARKCSGGVASRVTASSARPT